MNNNTTNTATLEQIKNYGGTISTWIKVPVLCFNLTNNIVLKFNDQQSIEESELYSKMFDAYLSLENILLNSGYAIKTKNNELIGITGKKSFNQ